MKVIECKDEAAWLEARKTLLTASDVASIFGANPFKSELALWAEKTGAIESADLSESEPVQWGKEFQGAIGRRFAQKTGREVEEAERFNIYVHPDVDFLGATLDFWENDKAKGRGILEAKATDFQWEEDAPAHYQIQLQCQLAVTRIPYGTLCAFNGLKRPPVWIDYEAHPEFIKRLVSKAEAFWWRVQNKVAPPVENDTSESTRQALAALYPRDTGVQIALPPEAIDWSKELDQFKAQAKAIEDQIRARENALKAAIGEASYGVLADGSGWSWKEQVRIDPPRPEPRETRFRVLRRVRGK
jgi:putative phage-type endonuclease